jgi:hypothetical protein
MGYGGVSQVSRATGLSRTTITRGTQEVKNLDESGLPQSRIRQVGGGRKSFIQKDTKLRQSLDAILSETTAGDPMSCLKWTCKSVRHITKQLNKEGHDVSYRTIHRQLIEMGYSLQSNRKTLSRENDPNRDRQFRLINRKVLKFIREGLPVISVDTKKNEIVESLPILRGTVASQGRASTGRGSRFCFPRQRDSDSLWGLRYREKRRAGFYWDIERHGRIHSQQSFAVVAGIRKETLPECRQDIQDIDLCGRW